MPTFGQDSPPPPPIGDTDRIVADISHFKSTKTPVATFNNKIIKKLILSKCITKSHAKHNCVFAFQAKQKSRTNDLISFGHITKVDLCRSMENESHKPVAILIYNDIHILIFDNYSLRYFDITQHTIDLKYLHMEKLIDKNTKSEFIYIFEPHFEFYLFDNTKLITSGYHFHLPGHDLPD